jgi:transcription initiation factor TFIIH subunit 1
MGGLLALSTARRGLGQQAGLANSLMGTVQGTQDGKSQKVNFILTNKQIAQIFAERPAVRRAYLKHVAPAGRMKDEEFWNLYCKVEYFKLARKGKATENEQEAKDAALFEEDEAEAQASKAEAAAEAAKLMPSINMAAGAADEALRPGWGLAHAGLDTDAVPSHGAGKVSVTAALVRDLNRHAAVVLQGVPDALPEDRAALARAAHARDGGSHAPAAPSVGSTEEDETMLDALTAPAAPATQLLRITDPRRYFDTGADAADPMAPPRRAAQQQPRGAVTWTALTAQIPHIVPPCPVLPGDPAKAALGDVAHVAGRPAQQLGFGAGGGGDVPEAVKRGLKEQVRDARELLKFYWQLVARNTSAAAAKAERVLGALTAVYDRLEAMKAGLAGMARHTASQQLQPLMAALDKALDHAKGGGAGGEAMALG